MARIPQATPQGRTSLGPQFSVFSDSSAGSTGASIARAGQALQQKGREMEAKEDAFNYALAKSSFLTADIQSRAALEEDAEWESWEKKHEENLKAALDGSVNQISSKHDRAMFQLEADQQIARSLIEVRAKANIRRVDEGRTNLKAGLDSMLRVAMEADDPATRQHLVQTAQEMIEAGRDADIPILTAQEADQLRTEWVSKYATSAVALMPDEVQLQILKKPGGTPAQYIDPVTRQQMFREAESRDKERKLLTAATEGVDRITGKYPNLLGAEEQKKALADADKIKDPEVRDKTRRMLKERINEQQAIEATRDDEALTNVMNHVEEGRRVEDIDPADWERLTPAERRTAEARLIEVQEDADRPTDEQIVFKWNTLPVAERAKLTPAKLWAEYTAHMSKSLADRTAREWNVAVAAQAGDEQAAAEVRDGLNQSQMLERALVSAGLFERKPTVSSTDSQRARWQRMEQSINDKVIAEAEAKGRKLSSAELRQLIDDETRRIVMLRDYNWFGLTYKDQPIPVGAIGPDELKEVAMPLDVMSKDQVNRIRNMGVSAGTKLDDGDIEHIGAVLYLTEGRLSTDEENALILRLIDEL